MIGLALTRYSFRGRGALNGIIFLPMATPEIVLGASMLTLFVATALPPLAGHPSRRSTRPGFTTILIAHILFNISFVVVTVKARLSGFDRNLEEAAMDLGANELVTFWKMTFPLILPGILAAALLAFSLSIDDFVITNFVSGHDEHVPDLDLRRIRERLAGPDQRHRLDRSSSAPSAWSGSAHRRPGGAACRIRVEREATHARHRRRPDADGPARPLRRAGGLEPDHEPRRRPRRGLVADHPRRRALPRLLVGDRRHEHRSRPSAGRGGGRRPGHQAAPRPAEHRLPRARAASVRPAPDRPARRAVAGVPVELRRGGRRGLGQAGPGRDRPAGRSWRSAAATTAGRRRRWP